MAIKTEIRKRLLNQRNALSTEEVNEKSTMVFKQLCALRQYNKAKTILTYMDYKNEVMTGEFIKRCRRDGKRVVLPKVETGNGDKVLPISDKVLLVPDNTLSLPDKVLSVYEINDIERDTLPGFRGIPEPNSTVLNRVDPTEIDLAVIPGVAFDYSRHRVGYGAGYYDRFLTSLRADCIKAGIAYSLQIVDAIPVGKYDMAMDIVVTEDRLI